MKRLLILGALLSTAVANAKPASTLESSAMAKTLTAEFLCIYDDANSTIKFGLINEGYWKSGFLYELEKSTGRHQAFGVGQMRVVGPAAPLSFRTGNGYARLDISNLNYETRTASGLLTIRQGRNVPPLKYIMQCYIGGVLNY